jgi:diguanylate cyclase (GGDEF)-like protein/PAS domain S-box-containing protein
LRHSNNRKDIFFSAYIRDITERKLFENELRIAATAFESHEAMLITNANQIILKVNQAFTRITGYSAEEAIGKTPAMLKSGNQDKQFYDAMWVALNRDKFWQGEIWNRRKDGELYPEWLSISAVTDAGGQICNYVAAFADTTAIKKSEETIHNLAFYDPLTKLPNRRLLIERLQQALNSSTRHLNHGAILFIDLDNFKELNDIKGYDIGDLLLVEVAKRLQLCARSDDTVACLGGDDFVVVLEELSTEADQAAAQAESIAEKIRIAISQPFELQGLQHHNASSIGISLFRNHETSVDELLKHTDMAMYQAKQSGRNTIRFFDPATHVAMEAHIALGTELRQALPDNQFRLYYQMQVDSADTILGAEVLIRWQHPERGLLSPIHFIPLAEESGLIVPIGRWVLETACAQIKRWEADVNTRHLQLAVNVSALQFRQSDFVEQVCKVLEKAAINPGNLKLELTETLVLEDVNDTIAKIQALKKLGIHFSMDDFGTGYSSLSYLSRLPLDQLKIDQSFVYNIGIKPSDAVIVQTIIGMAKNLDMEVIAEGVETEQQRDFLERNGCTHYQGYLFGKPVPLEEFEQLLRGA